MRRTELRLISSADARRPRRPCARWRPLAGRGAALLAVLPSLLGALGCVTIYQPQKAIHRPVVVDRAPDNFDGLRVLVRCVSHEEHLPAPSASRLCGWVAEEFNKQGAETEIVVPVGNAYVEPDVFEGDRPDLTVVIESRTEHEYINPWTVFISVITFTAAPAISEKTFSQRVLVLGRDGSVLIEEVYRERFVDYVGLGVWSTNYLLDWFVRDDANAVSGDVAEKEFTKDFHGQLRQLTFNAKVRSEVLGLTKGKRNKRGVLVPDAPDATDAKGDDEGSAGEGGSASAAGAAGDSDSDVSGRPAGEGAAATGGDPAEGG